MQIPVEFLKTVMQEAATASAQGKSATGSGEVARASTKRKDLEVAVKAKQEELDRLTVEMERINGEDDGLRVFLSLFGDDMGAGRVADEMGRASAAMKLAQEEILVQATAIEMTLKELQNSQAELGQRTADRSKLDDEVDVALMARGE